MHISFQLRYFLISLLCYLSAPVGLPIEVGILLCLPYLLGVIKYNKKESLGYLQPPFLLTCSFFFIIILGTIPIKYNWFPRVVFIYGEFDERTLWKCIFVSMIAITSCWLSFCTLNNIFKKRSTVHFDRATPIIRKSSHILLILLLLLLTYLVATKRFGYFSEDQDSNNMTEYILKFCNLIVGAFFLYRKKEESKIQKIYLLIVLYMSLIGAISGSKSLIIMPFLILALSEIFRTKKFINKYTRLIPVIVLVAFVVIIPIRYMIEVDNNKMSTQDAAVLVQDVAETSDNSVFGMVLIDAISRFNYVPVLANAIEYIGELPHSVTNLWYYSFMSPIYSLVPRFVYPDKPINDFARWYSFNVCHSTENNSISATYQGILFMNGEILSVIFGFIVVGFFFFLMSKFWLNYNHIYIFITLIPTFIVLPSEPWSFMVGTIQNIIIYSIFHRIILK